jgi:hypothetical protein
MDTTAVNTMPMSFELQFSVVNAYLMETTQIISALFFLEEKEPIGKDASA